MNATATSAKRRFRFTLRALFAATLLIAAIFGWRASSQRAERRLAEMEMRTKYAEQELQRARDEGASLGRIESDKSRVFWMADLEGAHWSGVIFHSPTNAFQRASLRNCLLEDARLSADTSSFQLARFDGARLARAKLVGGDCSFQHATFVGADLRAAVLQGGAASFQGASFEGASLVDARLIGSFQLVNINEANFSGADLSAVSAESLASCYFQTAPTYDRRTRFPAGFDPAQHLWRLKNN